MAKKILSLVQSDLALQLLANTSGHSTCLHNPSKSSSSHSHQHPHLDSTKTSCCIFCGDFFKTHLSQNRSTLTNINGTPCHLLRHEQTRSRHSKSGERYCYSWSFRVWLQSMLLQWTLVHLVQITNTCSPTMQYHCLACSLSTHPSSLPNEKQPAVI